MPINHLDSKTNKNEQTYVGKVVDIREVEGYRNFSDTLDYSDIQWTKVKQALVYMGRKTYDDYFAHLKYHQYGELSDKFELIDLEIKDRFEWIECSNTLTWRGVPFSSPEIDECAIQDEIIMDDLAAWKAWHEDEKAQQEAKEERKKEEERRLQAENELNRPVVGKVMIVYKGRKAKPGTYGKVAYISHVNGYGYDSVLLKPVNCDLNDRSVKGIWVPSYNLRLYREGYCWKKHDECVAHEEFSKACGKTLKVFEVCVK